MRFSVITIALNAEKYLEQTLQSVARQTWKDYEHIVWDGGSTDATLEICRQFPHVKVFSGQDSGIADAMNKGASYAQGEFLLHLHADDFLLHENVLSYVHTTLKQHPKVQWLYGQIDRIDSHGEKVSSPAVVPFSKNKLRRYNIISHPATFYSKELFLAVKGFDVSLRYCMDYDLWLRFAKLSQPLVIPSTLACFREHLGSLSTKESLAVTDEAYQVRNRYVRNIWERYRSYCTWKRRRKKQNLD